MSRDQLAREIERRPLAVMLRVEVRWFVFLVEHPNHDSKEYRDDGHSLSIASSVDRDGLTFAMSRGAPASDPRRRLQLMLGAMSSGDTRPFDTANCTSNTRSRQCRRINLDLEVSYVEGHVSNENRRGVNSHRSDYPW